MSPGKARTPNALVQLVTRSTLLYLIDPVRGEPTVHNLDRHPRDGSWGYKHLHWKFLDSFALICSTSRKGRETASAVCLEQGNGSNVLRVCRNLGLPPQDRFLLEEILDDLAVIANQGHATDQVENEILRKIINLDKDKIDYLLDKMRQPDVQRDIADGLSLTIPSNIGRESNREDFQHWVSNLSVFAAPRADVNADDLISHIKWASRARWVYASEMDSLFSDGEGKSPPWIITIHKLGRYYAAALALIKFAVKQPAIFKSISIQAVEAPEPQDFRIKDRTALMAILQRIDKTRHDDFLSGLAKHWIKQDPEAHFRKTCHRTLTTHAEMQLLGFYDDHPKLIPRLLFMGSSKKACYLCFNFMSLHPSKMQVSACHQKIYPSWMPASCSAPSVQKKYQDLTWKLIRHLEVAIAGDLKTRLGLRRPNNLDSTAGPSLSLVGDVLSRPWRIAQDD